MSLNTDPLLLPWQAVIGSLTETIEGMSALRASDRWLLGQVMFLNQPYVIITASDEAVLLIIPPAYFCLCVAVVE